MIKSEFDVLEDGDDRQAVSDFRSDPEKVSGRLSGQTFGSDQRNFLQNFRAGLEVFVVLTGRVFVRNDLKSLKHKIQFKKGISFQFFFRSMRQYMSPRGMG